MGRGFSAQHGRLVSAIRSCHRLNAEIEEERRLLYVAMTRAEDQLHLMVPQRFFTHGQRSTGDRHVYAQRTRFIPNSVSDIFDPRRSVLRRRRHYHES